MEKKIENIISKLKELESNSNFTEKDIEKYQNQLCEIDEMVG
jgi:peptidoglycan hydrolase CwlO-like protein